MFVLRKSYDELAETTRRVIAERDDLQAKVDRMTGGLRQNRRKAGDGGSGC